MNEPSKLADILQEVADDIDKLEPWERVNIPWLQSVLAPLLREAADTIRAERWNKRVFECEADEYGGLTILNRRFAPQELCTVDGVYTYGERDELRAYALSCGHEFQWDHVDPPAYCPICGARAVDE